MSKKIKILFLMLFVLVFAALIYWMSPDVEVPNNTEHLKEEKVDKVNNVSSEIKSNNKLTPVKFNPNTDWKDKTLNFNGKELNYKFGEGNPAETALSPDEYLAKGEKDGTPYVTPKTEKDLYNFLNDDDLPAVLDKCENYNRQNMIKLNPNLPVDQIPILLNPSDFDIENIMTINPETGRKEINEDIANRINEFLNILSNPMAGTEFGDKCAGIAYSQSIERIKNKFSEFNRSYINGGEGIKGSDWPK